MVHTVLEAGAGSPRNRRFRGVLRRVLSLGAAPPRIDLETEILDHVIGEQLAAHRLYPRPRLLDAGGVEQHLDVLPDADVGDLTEAERAQALLDGDALRVVDDRLGRHDHARQRLRSGCGAHRSLRAFRGNSGLPTRRWYAVPSQYLELSGVSTSSINTI